MHTVYVQDLNLEIGSNKPAPHTQRCTDGRVVVVFSRAVVHNNTQHPSPNMSRNKKVPKKFPCSPS